MTVSASLRFVRWEQRDEVRVLEDLEIAVDGRPRDAWVAGERGGIDDLSMEEGRNREEPGEAREIANESLGLDFLSQVQLGISLTTMPSFFQYK